MSAQTKHSVSKLIVLQFKSHWIQNYVFVPNPATLPSYSYFSGALGAIDSMS
jgi:hypothetical protein